MPMHAFLELTGNGTAQQNHVKGKTPIIGFNHQVDPQSTNIFVVRKKIDAQSPELFEKMQAQEELPQWRLDLWHMPRSGPEENYQSMALEGAKIAWISWVMPDLQIPGNDVIHEYEDVAFSYTKLKFPSVAKKKS
jgi:type VI secretion system Hcp family effector